jgi:hypothetical protein
MMRMRIRLTSKSGSKIDIDIDTIFFNTQILSELLERNLFYNGIFYSP